MYGPYEYIRARLNRVVDQETEARFRDQHKELLREGSEGARWRRAQDGSWVRWSHLGDEWEPATPPDALIEMAGDSPPNAEWTRTPYTGWIRVDAGAPATPPPADAPMPSTTPTSPAAATVSTPPPAPAPPKADKPAATVPPPSAEPAPPSQPEQDPWRDTPAKPNDPWRDLPAARQKWDMEFKREEAFGWVGGAPKHSAPIKGTPQKPAVTPHGKEKRKLFRKKKD